MKKKISKKKQKGIAERKTEVKRRRDIPYKAIGMGVILWLLVTWLFFGRGIVTKVSYQMGDVFPASIEALVDFQCENLSLTALAQDQAAAGVPLIFSLATQPEKRAVKQVQTVFDRLEQVATATEEETEHQIASLNDVLLGFDLDAAGFIQAFPSNSIALTREALSGRLKEVMSLGIIADKTRDNFAEGNPNRALTIKSDTETQARNESLANIKSQQEAVQTISARFTNQTQRGLISKLLTSVVKPNLEYDADATESLRQKAIAAVPPTIESYSKGDSLASPGDIADAQKLLLLQEHNTKIQESRAATEQILEIAGNAVLLLVGLIASVVILRVGSGNLVRQVDKLLLLITLSLIPLGTAGLLAYLSTKHTPLTFELIPYIIPFALSVLLAGILVGSNAAIGLGFWCSSATAVLLGHSFPVFMLGMVVTITSASSARNVHRRSSLFRAGLWICVVKMLYVLLGVMLHEQLLSNVLWQLGAAVSSGAISAILTILLIPLFEKIFKITTDITLLELSDMGHPLLQKMAIQAPGTYHHSLMVATLAQNAAEAIGANPLLIRVCAYYHDIGKMAKPEFFTENIQHKENPHDELSPHMSALVISSHVKEGLTLAKRHKLPKPILDAIEQHHGNGLISFFYHKAKQQAGDGTTNMADLINESDFRYGGAPAVSPEMAILSLADASEAASRSIEKPTPQKISNLLDDIFAMKIRDGQMDYANLTMAEIKVVKQSFIFSLSNMLHGRIPYPKDHENKRSKPADKSSDSPPKAKTAG
ncbi:MAG: HDIG domain-containing protein [Pontiellaceae bacterium]|nr:HDIG domain-containing protein [Pontiellaceae bacterium]MBN2784440.1 HDIG domain-containing protein [Pontiellaceae bacterium]